MVESTGLTDLKIVVGYPRISWVGSGYYDHWGTFWKSLARTEENAQNRNFARPSLRLSVYKITEVLYGFEFKAFNQKNFRPTVSTKLTIAILRFLSVKTPISSNFFSCLGATCASGPAVPRKCLFSRANCHRARCDAAPHPKVNQSFGFNSRAVTAPAPSRSNAWTRAHALCLTCPSICGCPPHRFHPTKSNHSLWLKGRTPPLERKRLHQTLLQPSLRAMGSSGMGGLPLEKKGAEPTEWGDPTGTMAVWAKYNNDSVFDLLVNNEADGCTYHDSPLMARGPGKQTSGHGELRLTIARARLQQVAWVTPVVAKKRLERLASPNFA